MAFYAIKKKEIDSHYEKMAQIMPVSFGINVGFLSKSVACQYQCDC